MTSLEALKEFAKTLTKVKSSEIEKAPIPTIKELHPRANFKNDRELGVELEREFVQDPAAFIDGHLFRAHLKALFLTLKIPADAKRDGSLYEPHAEIVTTGGVRRDNVRSVILSIFGVVASRAKIKDERVRTSTHVHINATNWTTLDVMTLLTFWGLVDHHIVHAFGGHARSNNTYCMTGDESFNNYKAILDSFEVINSGSNIFVAGFFDKYNSLNLANLSQIGTVEFRFLPGHMNADETADAVCWLYDLVQHVLKEYKSPDDVINAFSKNGYNVHAMTFAKIKPTSPFLQRVADELGPLATSSKQAKENVLIVRHSIDWDAFYNRQRVAVKTGKYGLMSDNPGLVEDDLDEVDEDF